MFCADVLGGYIRYLGTPIPEGETFASLLDRTKTLTRWLSVGKGYKLMTDIQCTNSLIVEKVAVILDVPTRWSSVAALMGRILRYGKCF